MYVNVTVGNPMDEDTKVGAMISEEHAQKVMRYISLAVEEVGVFMCIYILF